MAHIVRLAPPSDYANYLNILSTAVCHNHRHIFSHFVFLTQQWNKSFYQKFQLLFTLFAFWYYSHNSYSTLDHKIIWQGGFCYVAINFNFPLINFLEKSQRNLFQQTCMMLPIEVVLKNSSMKWDVVKHKIHSFSILLFCICEFVLFCICFEEGGGQCACSNQKCPGGSQGCKLIDRVLPNMHRKQKQPGNGFSSDIFSIFQ